MYSQNNSTDRGWVSHQMTLGGGVQKETEDVLLVLDQRQQAVKTGNKLLCIRYPSSQRLLVKSGSVLESFKTLGARLFEPRNK